MFSHVELGDEFQSGQKGKRANQAAEPDCGHLAVQTDTGRNRRQESEADLKRWRVDDTPTKRTAIESRPSEERGCPQIYARRPSSLDCCSRRACVSGERRGPFLQGDSAIGLAMSSGQTTMRASLTHQARWEKCVR